MPARRPIRAMAELTPQERLQPALLDRLTDDDPLNKTEARERRVMTKRQLRQAVLRDLAWLFNATRMEPGTDFSRAPDVRRSVINFGLPALSGRAASSLDVIELERTIRQAILDFEPRILPPTLKVTALREPTAMDHHNVIGVQIQGQLWAQPVPIELLLRTEIDLETGRVDIADLVPSAGA
jgi:type VI secretion system protein ImpF